MTYTTLVVIALICVSGFVAYFGDLLGRKMGKKRLTLFNMRPRYTAIVVTTITGMLISALALATLVSVNSQFRRVFFRGEQIIKQNNALLTSNAGLVRLGAKLKDDIARQEKELALALKDAKLAKKQRDLAEKSVAKLQKQIAVKQKELADLRTRTGIAESELKQKRSELGLMQAQLEKEQEQLRLAHAQVAEAEQQLGAVEAKLTSTQDELKAAQTALSITYEEGNTAADLALHLRYKDIAFRQGEELARGIVKPPLTNIELRHEIHRLLDKASEKAAERGAKVGPNGRTINLKGWNEATNIETAANEIASAKSEVMVQIICSYNALKNEQIPVDIRLYLNKQIYRSNDLIAETGIDGSQSAGRILLALNDFLQTDVAEAATQAGVVPVAEQDPRAALGPNRQAQADELLALVEKIKAIDAPVSVSVHTTGSVRASDSLNIGNIRFTVEKAE